MTIRERWIVYPLLFLSIGLGLRSGFILKEMERHQSPEAAVGKLESNSIYTKDFGAKTARIDQLVCTSVMVVGPDKKPVIMMGAEAKTRDGVIEMLSADAKRLLVVHPGGTDRVILPLDKKSSAAPKDTKAKDAKTRDNSKDDAAGKSEKADAQSPESK